MIVTKNRKLTSKDRANLKARYARLASELKTLKDTEFGKAEDAAHYIYREMHDISTDLKNGYRPYSVWRESSAT